ncbi:MAG: hypothetical protein ACUZ8A_04625 [Candidatus Bathyanammoxibius sp.]
MKFLKSGYPLAVYVISVLSLVLIYETTVQGTYSRTIFMDGGAPTIPVPDETYNPDMTTLKVEEKFMYEIAVPKEQLEKGEITPDDLELIPVEDKDKIIFHQIECHYYRSVTERHTRTTDTMICNRTRQGTEYWLTDKTRFVEWEDWSDWVTLPRKGVAKKD